MLVGGLKGKILVYINIYRYYIQKQKGITTIMYGYAEKICSEFQVASKGVLNSIL